MKEHEPVRGQPVANEVGGRSHCPAYASPETYLAPRGQSDDARERQMVGEELRAPGCQTGEQL
jgi:hypothetical protein